MTTRRTRRIDARLAFVIVLVVVAVGAVAWRWVPRHSPPATPEMVKANEAIALGVEVADEPPSPPEDPTTDRQRLMAAGWQLMGTPYVYGAKGPDQLDCSGFTKVCYEAVGVSLPDGSFNQANGELPLDSLTGLVPGDLLFYRWHGANGVTHVTMYAGEGWVIGTGSPGQPKEVVVYPITDDLKGDGRVITYRHVVLADE